MSVDADHRRELCRLIASAFPEHQFLITTHDKTWARQLRAENVVGSNGSVEFYNWSIETGPQINFEADCWEKIKADMEKGDIPNAASRLRRASEEYFSLICNSLRAPITYKMSGRWELGEYLPSAIGQYKHLLSSAKASANSWANTELLQSINEMDSIASQVFTRTNAEQWAVNANVHYNNWVNFEKNDFIPVADAFQDLFAIFTCNTCHGILTVVNEGVRPAVLKCECGHVNLNLVAKEKSRNQKN